MKVVPSLSSRLYCVHRQGINLALIVHRILISLGGVLFAMLLAACGGGEQIVAIPIPETTGVAKAEAKFW